MKELEEEIEVLKKGNVAKTVEASDGIPLTIWSIVTFVLKLWARL